ncbi:MAG: filamentous hemagglutinin N-terminal domain-containing protein, partial [Methylobacter sp.]
MKTNLKKQTTHHHSLFGANLPLRSALNLAILAILYPSFSYANPDGAQVISGQVSIDTATPGVTTITNSPNAIINWQNFSIAQNELTQFIQQNAQSAVLNRVIGQNPSEIFGQLFSNGQVLLINPNGVVFGAGASIDTQGLIASSLNLSDQDFLTGNYHFMAGPTAGNILNEGIIRAGKDGNIILIAPQIKNNGIIKSDGGSITLAAGQELTITNLDDPDIRFQIQAPESSALNLGKLLTDGGAINVFANTIKHSGEINADSVEMDAQGNIRLVAQQDITLAPDSKISANNSQGDAGAIHIESKTGTTSAQGTIEAQASQSGKGGNIELLGEQVGVLDQSKIDASGESGGGQILIGGDYQGKNLDVHNAKTTYVGKDTTIKADAKTNGDGGKVIVWSDDATRAYGDISAKGGSRSGNGGFIETSAHWLDTTGIKINASSPYGRAGEWLLDPSNLTISSSPNSFDSALNITNLLNSDIETTLNSGTNVKLQTGAGGQDNGDINIDANIARTNTANSATATLSFIAHNNIIVGTNVNISSSGATTGKLNVVLNADSDSNGGAILMNDGSSIRSNGGDITLGGGANPLTTPALGVDGNSDGVQITNATLDAGAGNISIQGTGMTGADGIRIESLSQLITTSGNITLNGISGNGTDSNTGVNIFDSTLTTTSGELNIVGTGQGSGSDTKGVHLNNARLITNGNLNITAKGDGSAGDLLQSGGGIISNMGFSNPTTGSSDVTLSGHNLTLTDVRSQRHIVLNASGNVNLAMPADTGDTIDDQYFIYNLPFDFSFFGKSYSHAYISSNGLITFDKGTTAFYVATNTPAKNIAFLADYKAIAPAWSDWKLHTSLGKNIFISRPTSSELAVKWDVDDSADGLTSSGNEAINTAIFEAVLNASGDISFNYGAANNIFTGGMAIALSDGQGKNNSVTTSALMNNFASFNNLKSTTFTPNPTGSYTETVASSGGALVSTTPVYTGTSGFNIYTSDTLNPVLSALSTITVNATGSITQDGMIKSGSGDIVLDTADSYINNVGSNALNVSDNGRWLVYSTDPVNNTSGGLSPSFRHYGCQYATGCTNYTIPTTGNGLLYSITPVLSVTPGTASSRYGSPISSLAGLAYTLSGYIGDDEASSTVSGTASYTTDATSGLSADKYNIAYTAGLNNSLGYAFADNTASVAEYTITPALLILSITADNAKRVYGDANPIFTGNVTAGELANGDTLDSIGLEYKTLATQFSNVGDYPITPTITSSNYDFTGIPGQLTISKATLNIYAVPDTRVYNGTTNSSGVVTYELRGDDSFTTAPTQSFASKDALGINLSILQVNNDYTLDDGNSGLNYNIIPHDAQGTITPKALSATVTAPDRDYDGSRTATPTLTITDGLVADETVTATGEATFNSKDVLSANLVTVNSTALADGL